MRIPFVSFIPLEKELDQEIRAAFDRVLTRSWYIEGEEDKAFEREFAAYCGVKHCVGCGNGLDALTLALKALGMAGVRLQIEVLPQSELPKDGEPYMPTEMAKAMMKESSQMENFSREFELEVS